jgi:hypothetical protein
MGRLAAGAQVEYIHRDVFPGLNFIGAASPTTVAPIVSPATDELVVMTSLRYYFP